MDSTGIQIIRAHFSDQSDQSLPLVITSGHYDLKLPEWLKLNREALERDLLTYGGILFRGFGIDSAEAFKACLGCFNTEPLPYMFRSSPRKELDASVKNIFLSTSYPNNRSIRMHNESSYSRVWGKKIVFCCIRPAEKGGETPIADSRKVLKTINRDLIEKFRRLRVKYRRNLLPDLGMPWQEVFQTSSFHIAKEICRKYRLNSWLEGDGRMIVEWTKPAVVMHPVSNEETWFNHVFFFNKYSILDELKITADDPSAAEFLTSDTFFGDGSEITLAEYTEIKNAYDRNMVTFPYQKGDVLFLDNMLMAHGRNPYKGDRVIATAIMEAEYDAENY